MSWIKGTASSYIDLSNDIVEAATGTSINTPGISDGGTGYAVGEILTVVGGTSTIAAEIEVTSVSGGVIDGVRIHNAGVYTVAPSSPNACTGGGNEDCSLTFSSAANGWTVDRNTTWTGSERDVIMHGSGGGSDSIYVGWRTYNDSGNSVYNLELHGMTGYSSGSDHDEQPGVSPGFHDAVVAADKSGAYLLCADSPTSHAYWVSVTSYRIIIIVKVGASGYFNAYLGWGNRFATTSEYPYPMLVAGNSSNPEDSYTQSSKTSGLTDPWRSSVSPGNSTGPMLVRFTDGQWYGIHNQTTAEAISQLRNVIPCGRPSGSIPAADINSFTILTGAPNFDDIIKAQSGASPLANLYPTPSTVDQYTMWPTVIVFSDPSEQVPMEIDDVFWVHTQGGVVSEDRFDDGTDWYRIFQNCNRTDVWAHLAIKEA